MLQLQAAERFRSGPYLLARYNMSRPDEMRALLAAFMRQG